jgi:hypothetical protein
MRSEGRGQRSEVRGQKSEIRSRERGHVSAVKDGPLISVPLTSDF